MLHLLPGRLSLEIDRPEQRATARTRVPVAGASGTEAFVGVAGLVVFFRASSRAAFAAASISALAEARVLCSCRCAPTNSINWCGRSRSSSSAVPVIASGVVIALSSASDAFWGNDSRPEGIAFNKRNG